MRLRALRTLGALVSALIGLDGVVALCGAGLILYGLSLVFEPAAFIVAGGFLLALALWRL